jgi:flagellar basal body-associated protein FliL
MDAVIEGYKTLLTTINQTVLAATALITISITIYEKLVKNQTAKIKIFIRSTWIFLIISVLFGLFTGHHISFFLINNLKNKTGENRLDDIKIGAILHFIFFLLGIAAIIAFGWLSIKSSTTSEKTTDEPEPAEKKQELEYDVEQKKENPTRDIDSVTE